MATEPSAPSSPRVAQRIDEARDFATAAFRNTLNILHFNDVYNIEGFKKEPLGGAARFRTMLLKHGAARVPHSDEIAESIVLFSGDAFAPSVMSTMLKGAQMPPVLDKLGIDCAMLGNHDFDFGLDRCRELQAGTRFPWLLSNCSLKAEPDKRLGDGKRLHVLERHGRKLGLIGLIEYEWLSTLASVAVDEVEYTDFVQCARELAEELRSEHKVDAVIALTHMRAPNDRKLAQEAGDVLDVILGGHDHHYEVFEDETTGCPVFKSGTDFKDATLLTLEFVADDGDGDDDKGESHTDDGERTQRRRRTARVSKHERIVVDSTFIPDPDVLETVESFSAAVESTLDEPVGLLASCLDCRFKAVRTSETNGGNLIADVMRAAAGADVALLNSGTLRSDTVHAAGIFSRRDLVNLLPMADEVCVIEMTGVRLKLALENSVSQFPRLEGRFAQVSGVRFTFDASKEAMHRVSDVIVGAEPLKDDSKYTVATKNYMRTGKDGYDVLPQCPVLTDSEALPALQNMIANYFERLHVIAQCASAANLRKSQNESGTLVVGGRRDATSNDPPQNDDALPRVLLKSASAPTAAVSHDDTMNGGVSEGAFTPVTPIRDGRIKLVGADPVVLPADGAAAESNTDATSSS